MIKMIPFENSLLREINASNKFVFNSVLEEKKFKEKFMNKILTTAIITIIAIFAISSASWAATYYIDAAIGNDSNLGTSSNQAWRTISRVNSMSFSPGDNIYFKRGANWNETLRPISGENGNLITYGAYGSGDTPTVRNLEVDGKSYLKVQNIEFYTNGGYVPVLITNSHHVIIQGCNVYAGPSCSAYVAFWMRKNSHYNEIINCNIEHRNTSRQDDAVNFRNNTNYNIMRGNTIRGGTHYSLALEGGLDDPSWNWTADFNIIQDNIIENWEGSTLSIATNSNNNLIEYNTIIGGKSTSFNVNLPRSFKSVSKNNIIRKNIIRDNPAKTGSGISTEVYKYGNLPPNVATENHVYNNVITNIAHDGYALVFSTNGNAGAYVENNFYKNNIIYNNGEGEGAYQYTQMIVQNNSAIRNLYFLNNLFYRSGANNILHVNGSASTVDRVEAADPIHYSGNIQQYPNLDSNYHPLPESPCIDAGDYLTKVTSRNGSGTTFSVSDAGYFTDGFGIIQGDTIMVGDSTATIDAIDYSNNTITLTTPISWENGDPVSLPYKGAKPDIGVFEFGSNSSLMLVAPSNLRIWQ